MGGGTARTCPRSTGEQASLTLPLVEEEAQKASYAAGGCLEELDGFLVQGEREEDVRDCNMNPPGAS